VVYVFTAGARAVLAGRDEELPSPRVRTHVGQWLLFHGSILAGPTAPA
jgi:hypothetical protein